MAVAVASEASRAELSADELSLALERVECASVLVVGVRARDKAARIVSNGQFGLRIFVDPGRHRDEWELFQMGVRCFWLEPTDEDGIFVRADTGERMKLSDAPPGAMWDVSWFGKPESRAYRINGTGIKLAVRLPNGHDWMPGSYSNNCTRPGEDHDCWCVHGDPPNLTVDKTPEPGRSTCQAGGGSIGSGKPGIPGYWHGFLRNGELVEA